MPASPPTSTVVEPDVSEIAERRDEPFQLGLAPDEPRARGPLAHGFMIPQRVDRKASPSHRFVVGSNGSTG